MAWFHGPLESPRLYDAVQRAFGAGGRSLDSVYARGFGRSAGRVLDIGCGPIQETPLPRGVLVGLDVNPRYVARYAAGAGTADCRILAAVGSGAALPFRDDVFDECRSSAVLHHLPDPLVRRTIGEMSRVLRPGGRIAIFDMVRPLRFSDGPLAWLLCALDRGRHVRTADALTGLIAAARPGAWAIETFEYAWPRLRGALLTLEEANGS